MGRSGADIQTYLIIHPTAANSAACYLLPYHTPCSKSPLEADLYGRSASNSTGVVFPRNASSSISFALVSEAVVVLLWLHDHLNPWFVHHVGWCCWSCCKEDGDADASDEKDAARRLKVGSVTAIMSSILEIIIIIFKKTKWR